DGGLPDVLATGNFGSRTVERFEVLSDYIGSKPLMCMEFWVGWLVGAGEFDKAYRLGNQNLRIAIIMNVIISVSIYLLGVPILGLFTHNPDIISIAKTILFIDIFVEFGRAFNHVISNALRGAGDVLYSMMVSIVSCWTIGILLSYILCIHLGLGLAGCWIAFAIDESFRGLLYYHRFRTKKWTKKVLI
ncbi:MAG TPA: MATE family efflux transporter, partial [Lachnospiraceae bacterium]|nr:MATE family efflux transporter [Lachnospiraceae bacterium]